MTTQETTPSSGNQFETLRSQEYVDITDGCPFTNSQNFYDFIWDSAENQVVRFPIVGIRQPDNSIRVYMLLKNIQNGKQDHQSLLARLGFTLDKLKLDAASVVFTTSLEGHRGYKPGGSYLELTAKNEFDNEPETKYIPLGQGSDMPSLYGSQFTDKGKQTLTKIFGLMNVQLHSN